MGEQFTKCSPSNYIAFTENSPLTVDKSAILW